MINVIGFTSDITARKQAEEELHQSQLLVQRQLMEIEAIYQTAPIGLTIFDRELRYVRLNQRLAEINGIEIDDRIGRTLREIVPSVADEDEPILNSVFTTGEPLLNIEISGETQAQPGVQRTWVQNSYPLKDETGQIAGINVVAHIRHCFETGEYWEDTFPLQGRDGTYRWFLSRALPIRDESGRIIRWFGTNTDITELQQAEAALADRNKELDSFAYTVSHDLKASLRAISNLSVWIEEDLDGKLPPDTEQQFDLLRTRVKRMESMIDSLLLYARAGRQEALLETFDFAGTLS